ncbi:hypothetical protein CI238_10153 [Colletotrichum incanum]|uniref:Uncharacterized protein n=1 Tax=Colletotrichum incanum TaxID=1573173 RepID=A0A162N7V0_COLIC|nr:hypothetical protein CI238_10153 [Colletotrichum incanum]
MVSFVLDSNDLPRIILKDKVYLQLLGCRREPFSARDSMQSSLCRFAPNEPIPTIATAVRSGQCIRLRSSTLNSVQLASAVELLVLKLQRACEGVCNTAIRYISVRGETLSSMWSFFPTPESQSPVCRADGRFPHPLGVCTTTRLQSAGSDENGAEQTVATQPPGLHDRSMLDMAGVRLELDPWWLAGLRGRSRKMSWHLNSIHIGVVVAGPYMASKGYSKLCPPLISLCYVAFDLSGRQLDM